MKHKIKTAADRLFDSEFAKYMKGVKKLKSRTWTVPQLRMIVKLKKGLNIKTYLTYYIKDKYQMHRTHGRQK